MLSIDANAEVFKIIRFNLIALIIVFFVTFAI